MDRTTPPEAGARAAGVFVSIHPIRTIPVVAFGMSLGLFLVISYSLCVLLYLLLPDWVLNHAVLVLFLPGFEWLSWHSFVLGLAESFGYGWYVALVFGSLYNVFARWRR